MITRFLSISVLFCSLVCFCTSNPATPPTDTAQTGDVLSRNQGKTLLLLMGMEMCPGTKTGTVVLKNYYPNKLADEVIVRVDAPAPGMPFEPVAVWDAPFAYEVDTARALAKKLDFFYYPTFYIIDKTGRIRFAGACTQAIIDSILPMYHAAAPGDTTVYTPAIMKRGDVVPDFRCTVMDRGGDSLSGMQGDTGSFLLFVSNTCALSMAIVPTADSVRNEFSSHGVNVMVVNQEGGPNDSITGIFTRGIPSIPVILDQNLQINTALGIPATPFYFLIDGQRKVVERGPYTSNTARIVLGKFLNVAVNVSDTTIAGGG